MSIPIEIERARANEIYYRSHGMFDAALTSQRLADALESGMSVGRSSYHIDRGASDGACLSIVDSLLYIESGDGAAVIAVTRSRAERVFLALAFFIEITPEDLIALGESLGQAQEEP